MKWNEIRGKALSEFPFFSKINFSYKSQIQLPLHPLIFYSSIFVLKLLQKDNIRKLGILFPERLHAALDLALISSFRLMKIDYDSGGNQPIGYTKGQKLYFNGCIVEFDGEYDDPKFGHSVNLNCRNGSVGFPWNEMTYFHPSDSARKLSSVTDISAAIRTIRSSKAPIDDILGIETHGNRSFFRKSVLLVSGVNETLSYFRDSAMNGNRMGDYIVLTRGDDGGQTVPLGGETASGTPSIVLCQDMISAGEFLLSNIDNIGIVIVDGMSKCIHDTQILDEMCDTNAKIVVITDYSEIEQLKYLKERDFELFGWNRESFGDELSMGGNEDTEYSYSIRNFLRNSTDITKCSSSSLEMLMDQMLNIAKYPIENEAVDDVRYGLIGLVNTLSRLSWIPSESWLNKFSIRVESVSNKVQSVRQWLPSDLLNSITSVLGAIRDFSANSNTNYQGKQSVLIELLKSLQDQKGFLIVEHDDDIDDAKNDIGRYVKMSEITVATADFCRNKNFSVGYKYAIIPGWMGTTRMSNLINNTNSIGKNILLYPEEEKWYRGFVSINRKREAQIDNPKCFSSLLGIDIPEIGIPLDMREDHQSSIDAFSVIDDVERMVIKRKYAAHALGADENEEKVACTLVIFEKDNFSFMTDTHVVYVLNELLQGKEEPELIKKTIADLQINDAVMFRFTERDIIREIADSILEESGHSEWRETSGLWKKVLRYEFEQRLYRNYHYLMRELRDHGLKRHPATVKQWMTEDTIGPHDNKDIDIISETVHDQNLKHRLQEVKDAIVKIRSIHLRASVFLMDQIKHSLETLPVSVVQDEDESFSADLGKFGRIEIHKVHEIVNDSVEVNRTKTNRILSASE